MRTLNTAKRQFFSPFLIAASLLGMAMLLVGELRSEDTKPGAITAKATPQKANPISAHPKSVSTVVLTIDYGDGMQKRFPALPWKDGMTVFDALAWAEIHPRGIKIGSRGKGATKLVTQIDDLKNGSAKKKNWIFRVNDKLADRSCGVFKLKAADRILWKFDEYK